MKLPPLSRLAPRSLHEALAMLQGDGAKLLSGGQSLVPMLAFRLAACTTLVDLQHVPGLQDIVSTTDGITLGAKVRWRDIERDADLAVGHPLMRQTVSHIAHYAIRNRGTVGGSLAHADPAAEFPALAVACDAVVDVRSASETRAIPARRFFLGPLATALEADEIIVAVRFPPWPSRRRFGVREFSRRKGDFALAGAIAFYDEDHDGAVTSATVAGFGVADTPILLGPASATLLGRRISPPLCEEAAQAAASAVEVSGDLHADADYRRALLATMIKRALLDASGASLQ